MRNVAMAMEGRMGKMRKRDSERGFTTIDTALIGIMTMASVEATPSPTATLGKAWVFNIYGPRPGLTGAVRRAHSSYTSMHETPPSRLTR